MKVKGILAVIPVLIIVTIWLITAGNLQESQMHFASNDDPLTTFFDNTWIALVLGSVGIIIASAVGILTLIMGSLKNREMEMFEAVEPVKRQFSENPRIIEKAKIWTCSYCQQVNNWADKSCFCCGSPRKLSSERMNKK